MGLKEVDEIEQEKQEVTVKKISLADREIVSSYLATNTVLSNFTCFEQLFAYVDKPNNSMYLVTFQGKKRFILVRNGIDIRIFFQKPTDDQSFIDWIHHAFKPSYIAYNLVPKDTQTTHEVETIREELIIDVLTIVLGLDKKLQKDIRYSEKNNAHITYRQATPEDIEAIYVFLRMWQNIGKQKQESTPSIQNVWNYICLFIQDPHVHISIALDGEKVVGLTAFSNHPKDYEVAVSTFSMALRGYKQLGVYIKYKQLLQIYSSGYTMSLIGGTESKEKTAFKMRFMKNGTKKTYHSYRVFTDTEREDEIAFLRNFWQ